MKRIASICLAAFVGLVSLAAAQEIPKEIKGGILNGKAVSLPHPEYPAEAKAAGLEGMVLVDVVIDESGTVISASAKPEVRKTRWVRKNESRDNEVPVADAALLREAAEKAALEARFAPTLLSGVPVKVSGTITYNFVLDGPGPVDGGILNEKARSLPAPVYPPAAMAVRASGIVAVKVIVDEEGNVIAAFAISGHPLLRPAAVEAAKDARFAPSPLSGQPVKASGILTYKFVMPDDN
jgi:TonB family protein